MSAGTRRAPEKRASAPSRSGTGRSAPREPETRGEWQEAVDAAHALLVLDAARQYGLVRGGPVPNVERCEEILKRGKQRRVKPSKHAIERFVIGLKKDAG